MNQAADANPRVPPAHYGRLQWLADEMSKLGHEMVMETARKWFAGETIPRPNTVKLLAQVMGADPAWLTLGQTSSVSTKEIKTRNALATGAVNLMAGMIQMAGWNIAFPGKAEALRKVDLQAIVKGAMYSIHVVVGFPVAEGWGFGVPVDAVGNFIIGVCHLNGFNYTLVELDTERLEELGTRKGGMIEIRVPANFEGWREIDSFSERL